MRLIKNIIKSFDDFKILKEKLQTCPSRRAIGTDSDV